MVVTTKPTRSRLPEPTAQQSVGVGQERLLMSDPPPPSPTELHVRPPSLVLKTPSSLSFTATQSVVVGHDMIVKVAPDGNDVVRHVRPPPAV